MFLKDVSSAFGDHGNAQQEQEHAEARRELSTDRPEIKDDNRTLGVEKNPCS